MDEENLDVLVFVRILRAKLTSIQPSEQIIPSLIPGKDVLIQNILPAFLLNFVLPENKVVSIILLLVKVFLEVFRVAHVFQDTLLGLNSRPLIVCILFVALLDYLSRSSKSVESEEMVSYVIVITILIVEDMVILITC